MAHPQNIGVTDGVQGAGQSIVMAMIAFMTISLYNVIELNVIIFSTFKRRTGLYFWSFIVATWGIAPHTIGFMIKFFNITSTNYLPVTLVAIGWVAMVTGQSVVLYSRLHIVVQNTQRLRWVLYMIIFNAIVFHTPVIILAYGTNSHNPSPFLKIYLIYDKVQIAVFFIQESIISILYIYETIVLLRPGGEFKTGRLRQLLVHLFIVNFVVLLLEITLLGVQYSGYYEIQTTLKPAVYSVKLKIEFSVLNRLVAFSQNSESLQGDINNNSYLFDTSGENDATWVNGVRSVNQNRIIKIESAPSGPKERLQPVAGATELVIESDESSKGTETSLTRGQREKSNQLDM
jgi:hypothetical protein